MLVFNVAKSSLLIVTLNGATFDKITRWTRKSVIAWDAFLLCVLLENKRLFDLSAPRTNSPLEKLY